MASATTTISQDETGDVFAELAEQFTDPEVETPVRVVVDITRARTPEGADAIQILGIIPDGLSFAQVERLRLDLGAAATFHRNMRLDAGLEL